MASIIQDTFNISSILFLIYFYILCFFISRLPLPFSRLHKNEKIFSRTYNLISHYCLLGNNQDRALERNKNEGMEIFFFNFSWFTNFFFQLLGRIRVTTKKLPEKQHPRLYFSFDIGCSFFYLSQSIKKITAHPLFDGFSTRVLYGIDNIKCLVGNSKIRNG